MSCETVAGGNVLEASSGVTCHSLGQQGLAWEASPCHVLMTLSAPASCSAAVL